MLSADLASIQTELQSLPPSLPPSFSPAPTRGRRVLAETSLPPSSAAGAAGIQFAEPQSLVSPPSPLSPRPPVITNAPVRSQMEANRS